MTDLSNIATALLLIAGEDEYAETRTGLDKISGEMKRAVDYRSSDAERLATAIADAGNSIANALNRIAQAMERRD
jgi:hypothetical protein